MARSTFASLCTRSLLICGIAALAACEQGFSQEDIDTTKKSIRSEFEKRDGIKVVDVQLIKESPKKLTGFVTLKMNLLGTPLEVSKTCTATMGEGSQYIWQCE